MSRLIDADALLKRVEREEIQAQIHGREFSTCFYNAGGTASTEWWFVEDLIENAPTIEPERENGIPMDAIKFILRKETVSTNPDDFTANEKFIKFMDDPEIASFGRWQHANGFNTALVAVECDLDKIPDSEPERETGKWIDTGSGQECDQCHEIQYGYDSGRRFCANCGARMEGK